MIWVEQMSAFIVPIMLILIIGTALFRKVPVYDSFLEGAKNGMTTVVKIFPAILAIYIAIAMLKTSGLLQAVAYVLKPVTSLIHMPDDILPLALLRPMSGSGAIALVDKILTVHGPDSLVGRIATVMSGSTETAFYTLAMYFGAAHVRKTSYALPAALVADFVSITMSVIICRLLFA
jgi:spore maturation protein B